MPEAKRNADVYLPDFISWGVTETDAGAPLILPSTPPPQRRPPVTGTWHRAQLSNGGCGRLAR